MARYRNKREYRKSWDEDQKTTSLNGLSVKTYERFWTDCQRKSRADERIFPNLERRKGWGKVQII